MLKTDAIVMDLATEVSREMAPFASLGRKCLIPINGQPAVSHLIGNLRQCKSVSRVILVSDQPGFVCEPEVDVCIDASGSLTEYVLTGLKAVEGSERCLIMNGDMPLASAEAIEDLLQCAPQADVVYPIAEKSEVCEVLPGRQAFYVETKEGHFTGSSCLLFDPKAALSREDMLIRLLNARNDSKQLLGIVGAGFAIKMMLTKLPLREFESHLSRSLGLKCRVFVTHFPELLCSIDRPEDVAMIERELRHPELDSGSARLDAESSSA